MTSYLIAMLLFFILAPSFATSQASSELAETIIKLDSIFWHSYNTCDIDGMGLYVSDDIEFYHDKGGLTETKTTLLEGIKTNLCSDEHYSLRRAALAGSIQVFPMNDYGAIMTGQHVFYVKQGDNPEFLDGLARFTHLWKFSNNEWKMTRILSYDHGPAPKNIDKKQVELTQSELAIFAGSYDLPSSSTVSFKVMDGQLFMDAGDMEAMIYAFSTNEFYHKEAPLTFTFVKSAKGVVEKMIVRENGKIVDEALRKH